MVRPFSLMGISIIVVNFIGDLIKVCINNYENNKGPYHKRSYYSVNFNLGIVTPYSYQKNKKTC